MRENGDKTLPGITFSGDITVHGPMFDIHDNEHVHIGQPFGEAAGHSGAQEHAQERDEEMFHFVHPELADQEAWRIHDAVKRVVRRQGIQMICQYLAQLRSEKKVLLPPNPSAAYAELVRMGMPSGEGFNETTFRKYYSSRK
jgi:hypothetical protein